MGYRAHHPLGGLVKQDYSAEQAARDAAQRRVAELLNLCSHHDFCPGNHDNPSSSFWCNHDEECERNHS